MIMMPLYILSRLLCGLKLWERYVKLNPTVYPYFFKRNCKSYGFKRHILWFCIWGISLVMIEEEYAYTQHFVAKCYLQVFYTNSRFFAIPMIKMYKIAK